MGRLCKGYCFYGNVLFEIIDGLFGAYVHGALLWHWRLVLTVRLRGSLVMSTKSHFPKTNTKLCRPPFVCLLKRSHFVKE